jgi:hypothetical protein
MATAVKGMDAALKSMDLVKVCHSALDVVAAPVELLFLSLAVGCFFFKAACCRAPRVLAQAIRYAQRVAVASCSDFDV